jgi:hypothetical protein
LAHHPKKRKTLKLWRLPKIDDFIARLNYRHHETSLESMRTIIQPDKHFIHPTIHLFKNKRMPIMVSLPCCMPIWLSILLERCLTIEHVGEPKKNEKNPPPPPSLSPQNLKGIKARHLECTLGPSIRCMKFLFPKEFVTI